MVLIDALRSWYCPECGLREITRGPVPNRFHTCPKLRFLTAPMVPVGIAAKLEVHEREDYVGSERVQMDGTGRPAMSIVTTRDDGQDCTVFAPTAAGVGASSGTA